MTTAIKAFRAIMIGAPASGKGTISAWIVRDFKVAHISSGDILRQHIKENTPIGAQVQKYMNEGQLVPDEIVMKCILDTTHDSGDRWLLDGFPRSINQAEKICENHKLDAVMHLNVPFDVIIDRVSNRWIHAPSGRVYNIGFNDPKVPFKDDLTGEDLIQRPDDKPEVVRQRLKIYDDITKPVLAYYRNKGLLAEFSGTTSKAIWPSLKEYLLNKNVL